jgi:hypothetical protein
MTPQPVASIITPQYTQPTTSDTIRYESGLILIVRNGGTSNTTDVVVPGNQAYSGAAKTDLSSGAFSNADRIFNIPAEAMDPVTGLVTVNHTAVTTVTCALIKH